MQLRSTANAVGLALLVVLSGGASGAQEMPAPKPGPEHEVLKADVGTWDAKVEMTPAPGMALMVSKGVETNVMGCGGLCLISDFKGEIGPGQPFHGHGVTVWDPAKKKYVGTWTDSMSSGMAMGESTYDAKTKKAEGWMHMTDPTGQPIKSRMVVEYSSPGNRVLTGWMVLPDGKEFQNMRISYTRRK